MSFFKNLFSLNGKIYPRIKHRNFINEITRIVGNDKSQIPIYEELIGDLIVTYSCDKGDSYESVSESFIAVKKMTVDDVKKSAYENGKKMVMKSTFEKLGDIYSVVIPNNLAACAILYPELMDGLEEQVGSPVIACMPHREWFIFAKKSDENISEIKDLIKHLGIEDNHYLSEDVYEKVEKYRDVNDHKFAEFPHQINVWKIVK